MESPPDLPQLTQEARSRVLWGEPVEEIRAWLLSQGMPDKDVDEVMAAALRERAKEFRKRGMSEMLVAVPFCLLPAGIILGIYLSGWIAVKLFSVLGVVILYGIYRFLRGLFWVIGGSKSSGSLAPS